jgi:electron transfer flavoprotein beta subunit
MKAVVCIKQTPSTTAVYNVNNGNVSWDDPGDKPQVLNPWDEYAVEEAIRLTENHGMSDAVAITMGGSSAEDQLKTCLSMGCSEAILVSDDAFAGSDTLGTARVLAAAIKAVGDVQIAVFGKMAIDGSTGQTPVQVAVKLGWTPLTFVSEIKEIADGKITVERMIEDGKETVSAPLPVVVSVVKEINEPRYPSFMGIRKANRATIPAWSSADLSPEGPVGAEASQANWSDISQPPPRDVKVEIMAGETIEEKARALADRLFEEKVI